ncbi:unnamed protein product [Darwinula stevensoni]|uniref:Uncharacterized protein n=1 Tax=Darwinula stevensoni TaxID=69355 RepID=A0A7R8XEE8_9CRUS|nr:unnamed protein product [Darwinula stevensoni]CAG0895712.1 unnamed protein product [Darwinula stevensoni]
MEAADREAWKTFSERRSLWSRVAVGIWLCGIASMCACYALELSVLGHVLLALVVTAPFTTLHIPYLIFNFDRRYRKSRCIAAGLSPDVYMLPNVPYVLVPETPAAYRTWYVTTPQIATLARGNYVRGRVHQDALPSILGKSWYLKSIRPSPREGVPPFVVKKVSSLAWRDMPCGDIVNVVLTNRPVPGESLRSAENGSRPGHVIPSVSSRVQASPEFDPPPSYEDVVKLSLHEPER